MKRIFTLFIILLPFLNFSQYYKQAVGIKVGYPGIIGLNGKFFFKKVYALDNMIGTNFDFEHRFIQAQSIFEYNQGFGMNEGYSWHVGLGPTAQYYVKGLYKDKDGIEEPKKLFLRFDALAGMEFTAPWTEFNVAIEAGPNINIIPFVKFSGFVNIALRYAINKKPSRIN